MATQSIPYSSLSTHDQALVLSFARARKGTIHTLNTLALKDFLKKRGPFAGLSYEKASTFQAQVGVTYAHLKAIREAVEAGERDVPDAPPAGREWVTITDLPIDLPDVRLYRSIKSGELQVGVAPTGNPPKSTYYVAGEEVSKAELAESLPSSSRQAPTYYTVGLKNIQSFK